MKVCEIFTSIQGESTYAGLLCTFIRLTGCNLRCTYCDTQYAYEEGQEYTMDELLKEVHAHGTSLVEVTGGEPLMQPQTPELIARVLDEGFKVLVETNGSVNIEGLDPRAVIILDIKLPSSGMADKMDLENLERVKGTDEIKFVIGERGDYDRAKELIRSYQLEQKCQVLMSPVFGRLDPELLVRWMVEDRLGVRLNLQLHKYIFGPERRGV